MAEMEDKRTFVCFFPLISFEFSTKTIVTILRGKRDVPDDVYVHQVSQSEVFPDLMNAVQLKTKLSSTTNKGQEETFDR
jgi:hypothetical protein